MESDHDRRQRRVSSPLRVVAGLLAVGAILAVFGIFQRPIKPDNIAAWILLICSLLLFILQFGFVAIWGRQPKFLDQFVESIDRELVRDAVHENRSWVATQASAIIVFGAATGFLFYLLASNYAFENTDHRAWVVYLVFSIAWFGVMSIFVLYSRHRFKKLVAGHETDSNRNESIR